VRKVIARIQGGLGNQLFCYAAARRVAIVSDAELVLDDVTGFLRDRKYRRMYQLSHFSIPCRVATPLERLEPLERVRRKLARDVSRVLPFGMRPYVAQEGDAFDARLLSLRVKGVVHLDGLWQSENYFRDIESQIRQDLRLQPPTDSVNQQMVAQIDSSSSVALHVRWFDSPNSSGLLNTSFDYYARAIAAMDERVPGAHYFLFSDHPEQARSRLALQPERCTVVVHNRGDANAYADLFLMSRCQHFIIANSTFSWWGAWLSDHEQKLIVCPRRGGAVGAWNFPGQIPNDWTQM
jgi:hypothetical protein